MPCRIYLGALLFLVTYSFKIVIMFVLSCSEIFFFSIDWCSGSDGFMFVWFKKLYIESGSGLHEMCNCVQKSANLSFVSLGIIHFIAL